MQLDNVIRYIIHAKQETPYGFWTQKDGLPCFTFFENQTVNVWICFESMDEFYVVLGEKSYVQMIEMNQNVFYQLLPQAQLHHIGDRRSKNLKFFLCKNSKLQHFTRINSNENLEETVSIQLLEENAFVDWQEGLYLQQGFHKLSIEINHVSAQTYSNCCVKSILDNASKLHFINNVFIQKEAEKAVAHQRNLNHVLDANSRVVSSPNLHVFNRKIEASHGTATQPISEEILFYLMSRGFSSNEAKQLYFDSFLGQFPIENPYVS